MCSRINPPQPSTSSSGWGATTTSLDPGNDLLDRSSGSVLDKAVQASHCASGVPTLLWSPKSSVAS
jgi:hypothetical protein